MTCRLLCLAFLLAAFAPSALAGATTTPAAPVPKPQPAADSAATAAERLYRAATGHTFKADTARMTPTLTALVAADNACSAGGELCEIAFDPWLAGGGQEGGISGMPRFVTQREDATSAQVRMEYVYAWDAASTEKMATLVDLSLAHARATWKLADLRWQSRGDADATSLVELLRAAYPSAAR